MKSIAALRNVQPREALEAWAAGFDADARALTTYDRALAFLGGVVSLPDLARFVSGKVILKALCEAFPVAPGRPRPFDLDLVNQYLEKRPDPPPALAALVERLIALGVRKP